MRCIESEATGMSLVRLLDQLDGVRRTGPGRWIAKCPTHDDRSPSLAVRELDDGTILIKCFAGCSAHDVVRALGLELRDLFVERPMNIARRPSRAWLDARDVLACVATEGHVLAIAASDIAEGRTITAADAVRIAQAAQRVRNAWRTFRGHS